MWLCHTSSAGWLQQLTAPLPPPPPSTTRQNRPERDTTSHEVTRHERKGQGDKGWAYKVRPSFFMFNIFYLLTPNHQGTQTTTPTQFDTPTTPSACAEHKKCTEMGTFFVFGTFSSPLHHWTQKNRPVWARFFVFGAPPLMGYAPPRPLNMKTRLGGRIFMFGASPTLRIPSNTSNMPIWACFTC